MNNLTVKDGFNFGCGFFIAAFLYSITIMVIVFFAVAVLGGSLLSLPIR